MLSVYPECTFIPSLFWNTLWYRMLVNGFSLEHMKCQNIVVSLEVQGNDYVVNT